MIHVVNKLLSEFDVHLASSSPRRKNILQQVGMVFSITPSVFEENLDKSKFSHPKEYVLETAKQKGLEVYNRLSNEKCNKKRFIIATDTVVVAENKILEKPKNNQDAYDMLNRLNKIKDHQVYSGVALIKSCDSGGQDIHQFYEMTEVVFGDIPDDIVHIYADSEEPLDKAGAYGIQGVGATLISQINGCYYNVKGFPLYAFCNEVYKWMKP